MPPIFGPAILGAIGTAAGRYFQKKSFDHQKEVEDRSIEVQRATEVFGTLSSALDTFFRSLMAAYPSRSWLLPLGLHRSSDSP